MNHDSMPMGVPALCALGIQSNYAASGQYGNNIRYAELHRLLYCVVGPFPTTDALSEAYGQRRFLIYVSEFTSAHRATGSLDLLDHGAVLSTGTVE
jgi:hypothetical protein